VTYLGSPRAEPLGSAVFPSIFLGAVSLSNRDHDPSTILRVMVRDSRMAHHPELVEGKGWQRLQLILPHFVTVSR